MAIINSPEYKHYAPLKQSLANALDTTKKLREKIAFEAKRRGIPWAEVMKAGKEITGETVGAGMAGLGIGQLQRILAALLGGMLDSLSTRAPKSVPNGEQSAKNGRRIAYRPRRKW